MSNEAPHLDSEQRHTLARISSHPINHNIKWPQVLALLESLGEVSVESKDRYRATVAGRTEVFRPPRHGDLPPDMVMNLRHFLTSAPATTEPTLSGRHLLVVIDHHTAQIYEFEPPAAQLTTIVPYDPRGRLRQLRHLDDHYQGQQAPEVPSYYGAVSEAVRGASTIVIFGHGAGHSDAAELLRERLSEHLTAPYPRVLVEARMDAKSFTEPQLLAAARQLIDEVEHGGGSGSR